jgi:hypothetical protein
LPERAALLLDLVTCTAVRRLRRGPRLDRQPVSEEGRLMAEPEKEDRGLVYDAIIAVVVLMLIIANWNDRLVDHVSSFLLELGQGFAFVGRQVRLDIGGDEF